MPKKEKKEKKEEGINLGVWLLSLLFWARGLIVALIISSIVIFGTMSLMTPIVGYWFAVAAGISFAIAFFMLGVKNITMVHRGIPVVLGQRLSEPNSGLSEGFIWVVPFFIDIHPISVAEVTVDVNMTEVMSGDDIPTKVDASIQLRVSNPYLFSSLTDYKKAIYDLTDKLTRIAISKMKAMEAATSKSEISERIRSGNGADNNNENDTKHKVIGLENHAKKQWGIEVLLINVTSVRLPKELEEDSTNIKREKLQAKAERIEMKNVKNLMKSLREEFPGFTDEQLAEIVQSERGKRKVISIKGGSPIERAGFLAGKGGEL